MSELLQKDLTAYSNFLPNQFSSSEKLKTFLGIFLNKVQELEDANLNLSNLSTNITLAYGYQLDIIGKLVGSLRKGKPDEQYREEILFQISLNTGNGTPENCIQYLSYVTQATKVSYWEHYPASVILETNGTNIPTNIPNTLDNITIAGVSVGGVITSESGRVFRGCELTEAYSNLTIFNSPYPEIELGGMNIECGNVLAECIIADNEAFSFISDSSELARCTLPELDEIYTNTNNGAGENVMACGEEEAECRSEFEKPLTTKGVFAEVYTKLN
tara:strand:+ start:1263 stop:2084 length:822 start_codon:yes stop_codon:yes gene_type:complete